MLATLLVADGEWITITPEGFFVASENGADLLNVVRGSDVFSSGQFYQALYRPDLVQEKLAGDPRGLVRDAASRLDLAQALNSGTTPIVQLSVPASLTAASSLLQVQAQISDRGGGIGRVEWRVNGVTVGIDTPSVAAQSANVTRSLNLDVGTNTVEVVAYNSANLIASRPSRSTVIVTAPAADPRAAVAPTARLFVLAAGLNDYNEPRLKLNGSVRDAQTLAKAFATTGAGFYRDVKVKVLVDAEVSEPKLDAAFKELAAQTLPTDVFIMYLAGHGKTVEGRYYFIPRDFKVSAGADEKTVNQAASRQGIAQEQWQRWFASIPARRSMILFDTCESGTFTGEVARTKTLEQSGANDRLAQATGRTIITASSGTQEAFEGYRGHGLFTYNVLDALDRADTDGNGTIEINELAVYVYAQVTSLSENVFRKRQEPQIKIASSYPLTKQGRVLAGDYPAIAQDNTPSFQVGQTASLRINPAAGSTVVRSLTAKTAVTVLRNEGDWSLVAVKGKPVGYMATRNLARIP